MGRVSKYTGAILLGFGLVDLLQSVFTGKFIYEYLSPVTIQAAGDASTQVVDYIREISGLARDALLIGTGAFIYHNNRIDDLERRIK